MVSEKDVLSKKLTNTISTSLHLRKHLNFNYFSDTKKTKCFMSYHSDRERRTRFFILVKVGMPPCKNSKSK